MGYARRLDVTRFAYLGVGATLDLSRDGIRFVAHEGIPERSRLELELVLDGRPARVDEARVLRVSALRDGTYEIAAHFERVAHGSQRTISSYVEERRSENRSAA